MKVFDQKHSRYGRTKDEREEENMKYMKNSNRFSNLGFLFVAVLFGTCGDTFAGLDSLSPTTFEVGAMANLTVKATPDSRCGAREVRVTAVPGGWTIDNGARRIAGNTAGLSLKFLSTGQFRVQDHAWSFGAE